MGEQRKSFKDSALRVRNEQLLGLWAEARSFLPLKQKANPSSSSQLKLWLKAEGQTHRDRLQREPTKQLKESLTRLHLACGCACKALKLAD